MLHFKIRRLLSAYADGELEKSAEENIRQHIRQCDSCLIILDEIKHSKKAISMISIPTAPKSIWKMVENELFEAKRNPKQQHASPFANLLDHRLKLILSAASIALLLILFKVWQFEDNVPEMTSTVEKHISTAGFNYGKYFDDIAAQRRADGFEKVYHGKPVDFKTADSIASIGDFHMCIIPSALTGYVLEEISVLTDLCHQSLEIRYIKDGNVIIVFQQPATHPYSLGSRKKEVVNIRSVYCEKMVVGDFIALTWELGNTRFVAIGRLETADFEAIVSASIMQAHS
ncbi:MAG: zf-HC2 domain-containing protein [Bacteroidetes bacterium]|nr:zf-HC2 domain-containing protein [Bacteroidota bacterium]